jgi:hypothetical protein
MTGVRAAGFAIGFAVGEALKRRSFWFVVGAAFGWGLHP